MSAMRVAYSWCGDWGGSPNDTVNMNMTYDDVGTAGASEHDSLCGSQQPDETTQLVSSVDRSNHAGVL